MLNLKQKFEEFSVKFIERENERTSGYDIHESHGSPFTIREEAETSPFHHYRAALSVTFHQFLLRKVGCLKCYMQI